jgi:imidazolonepropionase-like amidohydrolase
VNDDENPKAAIGLWRGKRAEMLERHDPVRAEILFDLFAESQTWHCPTLTVLRSIAHSDDKGLTGHESLRYVPPMMKSFWRPRETSPTVKESYRQSLAMTGKMFRAGVPLLAGTDVGNPYIAPGFSLHDELKLLVEAGLTPMAALQAATSNAARFMGRNDLGTVEVGKLADLVLLDANPLDDIANTTKINAVIYNGKFHDRVTLDRLLAEDEPKQ